MKRTSKRVMAVAVSLAMVLTGSTSALAATTNPEISDREIEHKTAALMECAMMIGAALAGASQSDIEKMERAASNIGIAFQIQDDILDITSTTEVLGKPVGSDEKNHKLTYVTLHGIEESKQQVKELSEEAVEILKSFETKNGFLVELVEQLVNREK